MIAQKQIQFPIGLILACAFTVALGTQPNQPVVDLQFVATKRPRAMKFEGIPPVMPTVAAGLDIHWHFAETDDPNATDLLKTPAGKSLSDLQRELIETDEAFWLICGNTKPGKSPFGRLHGYKHYSVLAASEADAKKMARALVEFLAQAGEQAQRSMKNHIRNLSQKQEQLRTSIPKAKEKAQAKNEERDRAYKKYREAVASSPYSLHPYNEVPVEVRKTISEVDKMLDMLNIEIVGIQSKISAIKMYSTEKDVLNSQTLTLALREMAIRQEIELVGAESRRQAIMNVKKREEGLYQLYMADYGLIREVADLRRAANQDEEKLKRIKEEMADLPPGNLPLEIDENKVRTCPVVQTR